MTYCVYTIGYADTYIITAIVLITNYTFKCHLVWYSRVIDIRIVNKYQHVYEHIIYIMIYFNIV